MPYHEQVTATHYPENYSAITMQPGEALLVSEHFERLVYDFGNDVSVTVPCVTDSEETFTIDLIDRNKEALYGKFHPVWQVAFINAQKTLRFSFTQDRVNIQRFEGDCFETASNLDVSDLWAVWFNVIEFEKEAEAQGFDRQQAKMRILRHHFPGLWDQNDEK